MNTILYHNIKTLIKNKFLVNFAYNFLKLMQINMNLFQHIQTPSRLGFLSCFPHELEIHNVNLISDVKSAQYTCVCKFSCFLIARYARLLIYFCGNAIQQIIAHINTPGIFNSLRH